MRELNIFEAQYVNGAEASPDSTNNENTQGVVTFQGEMTSNAFSALAIFGTVTAAVAATGIFIAGVITGKYILS